MPWTGWPRIPVQPGRSRTDRQTCGGCGPAADLSADTDPWHQCRAGISDQSFPRTTGTPGIFGTSPRPAARAAAFTDSICSAVLASGSPHRQ